MKDVGLRIRVQKELREQFVEACRKQDKPAAQVLREFMRQYIEKHGAPEGAANDQQSAGRIGKPKNTA